MLIDHGHAMLGTLIKYVTELTDDALDSLYGTSKAYFDACTFPRQYSRHISSDEFDRLLFNENFTYRQFITHLIFQVYKFYTHDILSRERISQQDTVKNAQKNPSFDFDVYRRSMDRGLDRMLERKYQDSARLGTSTEYIDLVSQKEKRVGEKAKAYHLTSLDCRAIENYQISGLRIVSLLENGSMADSKLGVKGKDIAAAYQEYHSYLQNNASLTDGKAWLTSFFDLASQETDLLISFLYAVAEYMNKHNQTQIPKLLPILCGLAGNVQSRFLYVRIRNIPRFFQNEDIVQKAYSQFAFLNEVQRDVLRHATQDSRVKLWISQISYDTAKAFFSEVYNLFSVCSFSGWASNTWNLKLVKAYRKAVRELTHDGHEKYMALLKKVPRSE